MASDEMWCEHLGPQGFRKGRLLGGGQYSQGNRLEGAVGADDVLVPNLSEPLDRSARRRDRRAVAAYPILPQASPAGILRPVDAPLEEGGAGLAGERAVPEAAEE